MPKILINEENNTSAGTPGRYGNYSVLITGYQQTVYNADAEGSALSTLHTANRADLCDENGVYEFTSKQAFLDTIGDVAPAKQEGSSNISEYHYGNRMAQELLDLGYTVIYRVINKIADMNNEAFWDIFKDKANYDFRFVSHGMLETCYDETTHTALYTRYNAIQEDKKMLSEIPAWAANNFASVKANWAAVVGGTINSDLEKATSFDNLSDQLKNECYNFRYKLLLKGNTETFGEGDTQVTGGGYTGFISSETETTQYGNYTTAKEKLAEVDGEPGEAEAALLAAINAHEDQGVSPTVFNNINTWIAKLASYVATDDPFVKVGRGDCVALIELDEHAYSEVASSDRPEVLIVEGINSNMASITAALGKYCALTVPSVYYKGKPHKFPGAFHYLACFMNSLQSGYAEWYAAAGYTRGISSYVIDHTSVKLGEIAVNALEPRNIIDQDQQPKFACNVIANFRGNYYLWGNRTAAQLGQTSGNDGDLTADHFLNIRHLCATIKKQLYVACRRFTFDPNSDTLWFNFVNAITPTLDAMKADQGIRDYKVVKVATDKKATLKARIRIIPIEAVEDFDITVSLEDSFGGTSVTAEG